MNKYLLAAAGLAVAGLLVAPVAGAAGSASTTIGLLEAQGFDVKIDRVGSAPLDECEVTEIRNPRVRRSIIDFDDDHNDDDDKNVFDIERRTITVSLDCSR